MTTRDADEVRARAEARFKKKEEQMAAASVALADVAAAKEAEQAKTARLRALRLAKEAADRDAAASGPLVKPRLKARATLRASRGGSERP